MTAPRPEPTDDQTETRIDAPQPRARKTRRPAPQQNAAQLLFCPRCTAAIADTHRPACPQCGYPLCPGCGE